MVHRMKQSAHAVFVGNIIPKTIVKLYDVAEEALRTGSLEKLREAQALQEIGMSFLSSSPSSPSSPSFPSSTSNQY